MLKDLEPPYGVFHMWFLTPISKRKDEYHAEQDGECFFEALK